MDSWKQNNNKFDMKDQHHHLYSWSPQLLGNLFKIVGLKVVDATVKRYSRTAASDKAFQSGGEGTFDKIRILSKIDSYAMFSYYSVVMFYFSFLNLI